MKKTDLQTKRPFPSSGLFYLMFLLKLTVLFSISSTGYAQNTPVALNGRLKLSGVQLTNERGQAIQLRGMSTHGPQWFGNCYNDGAFDALANNWGADVIRAAMYIDEGGYLSNKQGIKDKVNQIVNMCEARGMYVMIDWHVLTPGNPWAHINEAKEFFRQMASQHAGKKHVIYEICNEPNGVDWYTVKGYAEQIIPIIRQYDSQAIIIVGTPDYSSNFSQVVNAPLTGANAYNVMYTFHFYAGSHFTQTTFESYLSRIPVFVTEWGVSNYTGNGGDNFGNAQNWLDLLARRKISWCNWNFSDGGGSTDALNQGACGAGQWNNTKYSGGWVKQRLLSPADNFGGGGNTGSLVNGAIYKITAKHSGKCVDVSGISYDNGANIHQWTFLNANNQKWRANDIGGGFWKFTSIHSGKCLEVGAFSNADGGNVQQWDYVGHNYQQWQVEAVDAGAFKVINRGSGKALDVNGVSIDNGANIHQWSYGGGNNQKWLFSRVDGGRQANEDFMDPAAYETTSTNLVYPNPAQGAATIDLSGFNGATKKITISDTKNNILLEKTVTESSYLLDLNNITTGGLYILTVSDQYKVKVEKLIIDK